MPLTSCRIFSDMGMQRFLLDKNGKLKIEIKIENNYPKIRVDFKTTALVFVSLKILKHIVKMRKNKKLKEHGWTRSPVSSLHQARFSREGLSCLIPMQAHSSLTKA